MTTVRESGHYWIRVDGKREAEIGFWHSGEFWLTIGDDGQGVDAAKVEVLSRKLVGPVRTSSRAVLPLDTLNRFAITANGSTVVMQGRPPAVMHTTTAIELAAWLLMGAELAGHGNVLEVVAKTVEAIRAT